MGWMVGLTGGIGAGKSTVAKIFAVLGIPVYYADARARDLMNHDPALRAGIIDLLGSNAYQNDTLNRSFVAEKVFQDPVLLERLNALVHPAVGANYQGWHKLQQTPYTLEEAALLFENGAFLHMDAVINVHADRDIRIQRVVDRDGVSVNQVEARMDNQWPDNRRELMADYTIDNTGQHALIPQVLEIHRAIIELASQSQ